MTGRASFGALVIRNGAQLFFCFAGSALLNVLSQVFFAEHAPAAKDAWLSATLLAGTVAGLLGVEAARRVGLPARPLALGVALVAACTALFGGTFLLASPLAFALASVGQRFLVQYGTQELDRRAVALAGAENRRANDVVGLGMRFGGMLLGPLWFALAREAHAATVVVVVGMGALGAVTAARVAGVPAAEDEGAARGGGVEDAGDRALLAAARLIYAAYFLLASSILYVLADLHHVPAPSRAGGLMVTAVYGAAILATVAELVRGRKGRRSPREMLPAAIALLGVGAALPLPVAGRTGPLLAGAVVLGVAFARYQLAFRDHATHAAVHRGRPALLAAYNNLASTSALIGYGAMAAIVGVCRGIGVPYAEGAGVGVAVLGAAAVPFVVVGMRASKEERGSRGGRRGAETRFGD